MKEKVPSKITMVFDPHLIFFILLGNCSAICSSRSEVRDETSANISEKIGSYSSISNVAWCYMIRKQTVMKFLINCDKDMKDHFINLKV